MTWQDLGAIGEIVGGIGVILSLIYVAYQIRQSSHQIELNSRHIKASMYAETNATFSRWQALLAADESLARLWMRGLRGEDLSSEDRLRFHASLQMLFNAYENNFVQLQLGTIERDTLRIQREQIQRLLAAPAGKRWWKTQAPSSLNPEFRAAVEAMLSEPSQGRDES